MKEGERLGRWEGEIKPGQRHLNAECGMRNAEFKGRSGRLRMSYLTELECKLIFRFTK